jgi:type IV secretion system protein VirB10
MVGRSNLPDSPVNGGSASPINARPPSRARKITYALLSGVTLFGIGWITAQPPEKEKADERYTRADKVGEIGNPFVPIPTPAAPPVPPAAIPVAINRPPGPTAAAPTPGWAMPAMGLPAGPSRPVPISQFQASGGIAQQAAMGATPSMTANASAGRGGPDALSDRLNVGEDGGTAVATMLPDRNLFMTMGTPMPCILEQAIRTDVPGPFRCKVPMPVYSTSGAVPLVDSGTWIFGRISEPLARGSTRAFAVVTRLETPQGCLVKLRAPVGDQLGTSGIDGEVDNHFFQRFQGVAMLALLDAAGQAAAIAASRAIGGENGVSFNEFQSGSRDLAQGSYGDDINIPSTLRTHQARRVMIMAMEDIDMRPCFNPTAPSSR